MPEFTLSIETPEGTTTDEDVMARFDEAMRCSHAFAWHVGQAGGEPLAMTRSRKRSSGALPSPSRGRAR